MATPAEGQHGGSGRRLRYTLIALIFFGNENAHTTAIANFSAVHVPTLQS
jgi:hypothetical protein